MTKIKVKKLKTKDLPQKDEIGSKLPDQPYWNIKHFTFLQSYRETIDEKAAAKTAGLDAKEFKRMLLDPKIRHAMEDAKDDFCEALKLTPKKGARKFMAVYEKIEKRFDEGDSKVAGALSNMAATWLKATGQLDQSNNQVTPKVSINISLDSNKKEAKVVSKDKELNVDLISSDYE